jgi:Uma2 family endonuclease
MSATLVEQLLDHAAPARILKQVTESLEQEAHDRAAFREWLKPDVKAEFINGAIIMHSPAKRRHNQTVNFIAVLLELYCEQFDIGEVAIEKALVGLERNDVEPDVCFWRKETATRFTDDMDIYPAPDLVVEVLSKSTKGRDRGVKKEAYALDGVAEYWFVDPVAETVEQYVLAVENGDEPAYRLAGKFRGDNEITSSVIEGFRLPARACFYRSLRAEVVAKWSPR